MEFKPAVKHVLNNYINFSGRALRSEYWYWVLFTIIVSIVLNIVDAILGVQLFSTLFALAVLLPGIAVSVRRLHDIDKSGWWLLIGAAPLISVVVPQIPAELSAVIGLISLAGAIVLLYWLIQKGTEGPNRFGAAAPTA